MARIPAFLTLLGLPLDLKGFLNLGISDIWGPITCGGRLRAPLCTVGYPVLSPGSTN